MDGIGNVLIRVRNGMHGLIFPSKNEMLKVEWDLKGPRVEYVFGNGVRRNILQWTDWDGCVLMLSCTVRADADVRWVGGVGGRGRRVPATRVRPVAGRQTASAADGGPPAGCRAPGPVRRERRRRRPVSRGARAVDGMCGLGVWRYNWYGSMHDSASAVTGLAYLDVFF